MKIIKNLDLNSEIGQILHQKYDEDNIDRKIKREGVKQKRRFNGHLKTHYVGKLSSQEKCFSIFRHKLKMADKKSLNNLIDLEERIAQYYSHITFQNNTIKKIKQTSQAISENRQTSMKTGTQVSKIELKK